MTLRERIPVKTQREIAKMREAARHVAEILLEVREQVKPGVTTRELDACAERAVEQRGVTSSFKGYDPHDLPKFPAVLCVSVNDEIVHGIPGERALCSGDIVSLDFGVSVDGYHGDSAVTIPVGEIDGETQSLLDVTRGALEEGMGAMCGGRRLSDIGSAVQQHVESSGYSVVREFAGHGIGQALHEPPWIPNYGVAGRGPPLVPGMVFAVEPMVSAGRPEVNVDEDRWTARTADGSLSAHYEHTILITEQGPEPLTRIEGSH